MSKVFVIGGGASGLVAAIMAASNNEVTVLERNSSCCKKILLTGNGKCNYWNSDQDISHYHSTDISILTNIITDDLGNEVLDLFNSIGVYPKIKNGSYYPNSNQASSIKECLLKEAEIRNVKFINDTYVTDIKKVNDKFIIKTNNNEYQADKVIVSTGSKASPKTGSDGTGYTLLERLGHSIIEPLPSLVQLKGTGDYFKDWDGIRTDVNIKVYEDSKYIKEENGEIQLTSYGISGICTMQLSGIVNRGLYLKKKEQVVINFLPMFNPDTFIIEFDKRSILVKKRTVSELFDGLLNYKLSNLLLTLANINKNATWNNLSDKDKNKIKEYFISFKLDIISSNSFDEAQVCSGGVPLKEINPLTMESLKEEGLYITGEVLDVDGDCGGYNLGFAFRTGLIAGRNV